MRVGAGGLGGWGIVASCAFALLCAAAALAQSSTPFRDGGSTESLRSALELARSGLPPNAGVRRLLLDGLIADLGDRRSIGEAVGKRARAGDEKDLLLTGYYEPTLRASRTQGGPFRHPLYALPSDDASRRMTRRRIDDGGLEGRGLEIFWLDDPVESFFLHVQGSGRLRLQGGRAARVGYAGSNGHPYNSIGKELVARGVFTAREATAPAIKSWLRAHPDRLLEILHTNARFIFFREVSAPADRGPVGAMGVELVPFRSVAADPRVIPPGSVGLLVAPMPDGSLLRRVVVAMDQGAAIAGPGRLDLFVGAGEGADVLAGELRAPATVRWLELR